STSSRVSCVATSVCKAMEKVSRRMGHGVGIARRARKPSLKAFVGCGTKTGMDERRRDKRIPVDMWVEAEDGEDLYMQRAANLSVGGAFFAQTVPTLVGTKVKLRFQLPGDAD